MNVSMYVAAVNRTMNGGLTTRDAQLNYALGLTGEAGEVAELIKKHVFHKHPLEKEKLIKELGDVAWYLVALAETNGIPLADIFAANISKLKARYPDGFKTQDSYNRSAEA